MNLSFPFEKRPSTIFGQVHRPIAVVSFWSKKISGWAEIPMIVDTGADYTLLPRYQSQNLGVNLEKDCQLFTTQGIGGSENVYLQKSSRAKLGDKEFTIPLGFLDRDNVPPLLGRQDFLELISVTLDKHITVFDF